MPATALSYASAARRALAAPTPTKSPLPHTASLALPLTIDATIPLALASRDDRLGHLSVAHVAVTAAAALPRLPSP